MIILNERINHKLYSDLYRTKTLFMIKKVFSGLLLLITLSLKSQKTESITVKAGEDLSAVLSSHGLYKFPSFIIGTVLFKDGTTTNARLNFNVFMNQIQFIGDNGDTLIIDKPELTDSIKLDSTVFYYQKGYYEIIADHKNAKLARQQKINFESVKNGAYGRESPGASIETYGRIGTPFTTTTNVLILNEDIIVKRETLYILTYKKYRTTKATLAGFFSAFPDIKNETQTFVETNNINFKQEEDLKKLIQYCADLSSK
jgi:hypothetical protein